jgi:hypothetical protein
VSGALLRVTAPRTAPSPTLCPTRPGTIFALRHGRIIFRNGTSGSGKSPIAHELPAILDGDPSFRLAVDSIGAMNADKEADNEADKEADKEVAPAATARRDRPCISTSGCTRTACTTSSATAGRLPPSRDCAEHITARVEAYTDRGEAPTAFRRLREPGALT